MKRKGRAIFAVLVVAFLALGLGGAAPAQGGEPPGLARKIVVLSPDAVNEAARAQLEKLGAVIVKEIAAPRGTLLVVFLPEPAGRAAIQIAGVVRVEDDAVVYALPQPPQAQKSKPTPTPVPQPTESLPWGVNRIDADLAWGTTTGAGVVVAIIDTGIDKDHPDLMGNIAGGRNFVGSGPPWRRTVNPSAWDDDNGHGSHVAGIVAAVDNDIGVIGVASGAKLLGVKVLDRNGSGYVSDVVAGIYWAADNGARVINLSLGTSSDIQSLHDAVDYVYGSGVVVVAAAGNSGNSEGTGDNVIYPAKYDSVIAVAATDSVDTRAWWSSTGPAVELAAPGVSIPSTWKGGGYKNGSGTSMATPHVSGTAALVIASGRAVDTDGNYGVANEVRALLTATADDLGASGRDTWYGYGLVDAQEAATGVQSSP